MEEKKKKNKKGRKSLPLRGGEQGSQKIPIAEGKSLSQGQRQQMFWTLREGRGGMENPYPGEGGKKG